MPEPTTTTALATTGAVSAALGLASISPGWLVMAFFGALALQAFGTVTITRSRAIAQVACSSVLGALIGGALSHLGGAQAEVVRLLLCALGGFGTYPIMQVLIDRVISKLTAGGKE